MIDFRQNLAAHNEEEAAMFGLKLEDRAPVLLNQYQLVLVRILYWVPDHPLLLGEFTIQQVDIAPNYPVTRGFLNWWQRTLDGKISAVDIDGRPMFQGPPAARRVDKIFKM